MTQPEFTRSTAVFSDDLRYRYSLTREWDRAKPIVNYLLLNPSTADEVKLDPTLTRCYLRAAHLGFGAMIVTNIFAWRSTDPAALYKVDAPIGDDNNHWILEAAHFAKLIICGWGQHGEWKGRATQVRYLLRHYDLHALRVTNVEPWHPLYLPYTARPEIFQAAT